MTSRPAGHPTPDALLDAPQLAVLALLDDALHLGGSALIAAHSELMSGEGLDAPPESPAAWVARDALSLMDALGELLANYRISLRAPPSPPAPPAVNRR